MNRLPILLVMPPLALVADSGAVAPWRVELASRALRLSHVELGDLNPIRNELVAASVLLSDGVPVESSFYITFRHDGRWRVIVLNRDLVQVSGRKMEEKAFSVLKAKVQEAVRGAKA